MAETVGMAEARRMRYWLKKAWSIAIHSLATALLVIAFLSLATRIYLERAWKPVIIGNSIERPPTPIETLETSAHLERLEAAVELYRLRHSSYPERIEDLVADGLVTQEALTFPAYGDVYFYERVLETYDLYPPRF